jgi:hypothetical protein
MHKLLTALAKRVNKDRSIWYNCSLTPHIGGAWNCYICEKDFVFISSMNEITDHGFEHLKNSNLLPFL